MSGRDFPPRVEAPFRPGCMTALILPVAALAASLGIGAMIGNLR
jgi:hypothetical protein